jgi:hypothetical protein
MIQKVIFFIILLFVTTLSASNYAQDKLSKSDSANKSTIRRIRENRNKEDLLIKSTDLIIIGTAIQKRDIPAPRSELFHSEVIVKVDRVLKGTLNSKKIVVKQQSGSLSNDINKRMSTSLDGQLPYDKQVVIFLFFPKNDQFLNNVSGTNSYSTFNGKKSISELPADNFYVENYQVFSIINGLVYYKYGAEK